MGEPINPEAWRWYDEVVGNSICPIVDTWWQTETGGHMITPLPGLWDEKPGSATLPFFGVVPVILDEKVRVGGVEIDLGIKWGISGIHTRSGRVRQLYHIHVYFEQTTLPSGYLCACI